MSLLKKIALVSTICCACASADALEYKFNDNSFRISGFGTAGMINPDMETPLFIGDWRVRGQFTNSSLEHMKLGLVYALDQAALDKGNFSREVFGFVQSQTVGRIEFGFTDSIARKLGLGLPDVGGLRINDRPLYNEKIHADGPIIADTTLTSGRSKSLRINAVTNTDNGIQYGISASGITDDYDWAIDAGLKLRKSSGKVKTAYSVGASFMSQPDNFDNEVYTPGVTADWRSQLSLGMNLQYNSWIWGLTTRIIYDHNPIGPISDGIVVGTGVSYDLLKYTVSLTYMMSDTGIWQNDVADFVDHTTIASFRYKYSEFVDGWISGGITATTPFISAGMRITF